MTTPSFGEIDQYLEQLFVPEDPALEAALRASEAAGLPAIQVSATQGKFLHLMARMSGARRILELGTLGGYSTIWLARALPEGGRLVTLEFDPRHAVVARGNLANAGLADRVELLLGKASDTLSTLSDNGEAPFDFIFIDADKPSYPAYLEACLKLSRVGTVIVADNVVRSGAVIAPAMSDANAHGAHKFNAELAANGRVDATVVQLVGTKGHDGMAIAIVKR
jgi:predicted O-methyltransferase YrrM